MACHELPHWLGIAGEVLNFLGAICLAYDMLLREPERANRRQLQELHEFVVKYGLSGFGYKGLDVSSVDFAQSVMDRRATKFGLWGVALLAIGFLFLAGYHILEMSRM